MKNIIIETPCKAEVEKYLYKLEHDTAFETYREKNHLNWWIFLDIIIFS